MIKKLTNYPKRCPKCGSKKIRIIPNYSFKCLKCGYVNIRGQDRLKFQKQNEKETNTP